MSTSGATLYGFAYGEHLDGLPPRSLGYRLLAPAAPEPWGGEVEALARRLQGAPYPDHWPPTDLFCSVLLADGRRLVALARYGLADHTPSSRRGGLELVGVVAPGDLDVASALTAYRWLQARRLQVESLHAFDGHFALADVLSSTASAPPPSDPVPVLPVRMWQDGALLFAATTPTEPDHRLGLLEQGAGRGWQWLPLVGSDFPLSTYAQRGPVVAWTPHLAGVALRVERKHEEEAGRKSRRPSRLLAAGLLLGLVVLPALNLWATLRRYQELGKSANAVDPLPAPEPPAVRTPANDDTRDRFAEALHDLLRERMGPREWAQAQDVFLARYERAAKAHPDLRLAETNQKGRLAVGAVGVLSRRGADRVEEAMKKALANKGFDAALVDIAAARVREQLLEDARREAP